MAEKKIPSMPINGSIYDATMCPWCGGAAAIFRDKHDNPWARCSKCGCRAFGNKLAFDMGVANGIIDEAVTWPPVAAVG